MLSAFLTTKFDHTIYIVKHMTNTTKSVNGRGLIFNTANGQTSIFCRNKAVFRRHHFYMTIKTIFSNRDAFKLKSISLVRRTRIIQRFVIFCAISLNMKTAITYVLSLTILTHETHIFHCTTMNTLFKLFIFIFIIVVRNTTSRDIIEFIFMTTNLRVFVGKIFTKLIAVASVTKAFTVWKINCIIVTTTIVMTTNNPNSTFWCTIHIVS